MANGSGGLRELLTTADDGVLDTRSVVAYGENVLAGYAVGSRRPTACHVTEEHSTYSVAVLTGARVVPFACYV